jgi:hypothetical protein
MTNSPQGPSFNKKTLTHSDANAAKDLGWEIKQGEIKIAVLRLRNLHCDGEPTFYSHPGILEDNR